jgi:hypothetical protein
MQPSGCQPRLPGFQGGRFTSTIAAIVLIAAGLGLSGCENARKALGFEKSPPDEFRIVTRAPLSLPPDYGLRPPQPGAPRPQEVFGPQAARQALIGSTTTGFDGGSGAEARSSAESALLARAGADRANPGIRDTVNRESGQLAAADRSFLDRVMFWRAPPPIGTVVDAPREAQRLRENQALGRSVSEGETPTVKRKRRAPLEGIF